MYVEINGVLAFSCEDLEVASTEPSLLVYKIDVDGGCSAVVALLIVVQAVAGSIPVSHPIVYEVHTGHMGNSSYRRHGLHHLRCERVF